MNAQAAPGGDLQAALKQVCDRLIQADRVLLCGHKRPDGDCLGSMLALAAILERRGQQVRLYTAGPVKDKYHFLTGCERIETTFPAGWRSDLLVAIDSADRTRIELPEGDNAPAVHLNIDHHQSNTCFGEINYIDTAAAAAGEQIYEILRALNADLTPDIANCLLCAIMADTGGFRYSNTQPRTLEIAGALTRAGAATSAIALHIYDSKPQGTVRLMGRVINSIHYECDDRLAWSEIDHATIEDCGGEEALPDDLAALLRSIHGVQASCLFHETPEGWCRASLRSKSAIDVGAIAQALGGGGHRHAAGITLRQPYPAARAKILQALIAHCPPNDS